VQRPTPKTDRSLLEISVCIDGSATAYPAVPEAVEPVLGVPHPSVPALKTPLIPKDTAEQAEAEMVLSKTWECCVRAEARQLTKERFGVKTSV
jgi:hypothetical protein